VTLSPRIFIYAAAAAALVVGALAYSQMEEGHEETGLLAGDFVNVVVAVAALTIVAVVSFVYLAKRPPEEV
jgi:hypothetical protein